MSISLIKSHNTNTTHIHGASSKTLDMAIAFPASITRPPSSLHFSSKSSPISAQTYTVLFSRPPSSLATTLTITRAKNIRRESNSAMIADSDEDEEFIAFKDMRRWELNKPAGFGEGKAYDTTMEEKLLEEMERERAAQLAAEKAAAAKVTSNKKHQQQQPPQMDDVPSGPCVRLGNLPKKKNIYRDLQAAFKGFDGIVNISPANIGNQKTRDPICKGLAFVEFVSQEAAVRFVNTFSKQEILFGKVQKKISFDVINSEQLVSTHTSAQPKFTKVGAEKQEEFNGVSTADETVKLHATLMNVATAHLSDSEETEMGMGHLEIPQLSNNGTVSDVNDLGSKDLELQFQNRRKQIASKKKVVKKKSTKAAKPNLPSSMARLKIKERTILTGVFTKYGGKVASASD